MRFLHIISAIIISFNVYQIKAKPSLTKRLLYEISLEYTILKNKLLQKTCKSFWWNEIDNNIILSALPLIEHKNKFLELANSIKKKLAILSIVECFEMEPGWFHVPISPNDWKKANVKQLILETEDFYPPSINNIKKAIEFLYENENENYLTVVHCKAGIGRSAIIVVCKKIVEALINNNLKAEELEDQNLIKLVLFFINEVKKYRNTILLNKKQKEAIIEFIKYIKSINGDKWLNSLKK